VATDQLSRLVQRGMTDPAFVSRAQADLDGTLAAEGISLSPEELAAVREFHGQIAGLSQDEVQGRLSDAARRQGAP
jgi:hypothetical protein